MLGKQGLYVFLEISNVDWWILKHPSWWWRCCLGHLPVVMRYVIHLFSSSLIRHKHEWQAFSYAKTDCHPERKFSFLWTKFWDCLKHYIFWFTWASVELCLWRDLIIINVSKNSKLFIIKTFSLISYILSVPFSASREKNSIQLHYRLGNNSWVAPKFHSFL